MVLNAYERMQQQFSRPNPRHRIEHCSLVNPQLLQERMAPLVETGDPFVFLRADASVPYGYVMEVIDQVKRSGVARVGLVTRPLTGLAEDLPIPGRF